VSLGLNATDADAQTADLLRQDRVPAPAPARPNPAPALAVPVPVPVPVPAQVALPASPPNMASSPAPSFDESRAPQFKQLLEPETSGRAQRWTDRNNRARAKKEVNLKKKRSYKTGKAVDPPFLSSIADEPDEAPIQSVQIPANVAPASSYPPEDDSFSDVDRSEPMSTFLRSLADQHTVLKQNEDNESGTSSVKTTDMSI
jgi:hypothetical protein